MKNSNRPSLTQTILYAIIVAFLAISLLEFRWIMGLYFLPDTLSLLPIALVYTYLLFYIGGKKSGLLLVMGSQVLITLFSLIVPILQPLCFLGVLFSIWLSRILLYHQNFFERFLDGALVIFGLSWSIWIYRESHSEYLALWTFFLSQCLWVLIPSKASIERRVTSKSTFDQAFSQAEQAISKLQV